MNVQYKYWNLKHKKNEIVLVHSKGSQKYTFCIIIKYEFRKKLLWFCFENSFYFVWQMMFKNQPNINH
jgi:hypothetical protein